MDSKNNKDILYTIIKLLTIFLLASIIVLFIPSFIKIIYKNFTNNDSHIPNISQNSTNTTTNNSTEKIVNNFEKGLDKIVNKLTNNNKFSNENRINLIVLLEVYKNILENYYSTEPLDYKKLEYGAIRGMVEALGDKHSIFMDNIETKKFDNVLGQKFEGIGVIVTKNNSGAQIEEVLTGSPAEKEGLKAKDIIIEIDGMILEGLELNDITKYITGPSGTEITIKIKRGEKIIEKKVKREPIFIPSVSSKDLGDKEIGYISMRIFGEKSLKEFKDTLNKINNDDLKGIIIDLRDNSGGFLDGAIELLSIFIKKGENLVIVKSKEKEDEIYKSENSGDLFTKKIVVLVDSGSASSSEIFIGAIKDYKRGIIVGEKTYGKGSVQMQINLIDGSKLKLTIAKWFTPNNYSIDHEGIKPDIEVNFKQKDLKNLYDRQLEEAKKILKEYIKVGTIPVVVKKFNEEYEEEKIKEENKKKEGNKKIDKKNDDK